MAFGSPFILTAEVDQGPGLYQDQYTSGFTTYPLPNGARNPLGSRWCYKDSKGRMVIIAYVRLNTTAPPVSLLVGPVWWKDNTFTVVTAAANDASGWGVAAPNLTAGILLNTSWVNGNFGWIITAGYCGAGSDTNWGAPIAAPANTAIGDGVVGGTSGNQSVVRAAAGSPTYKQLYTALTAVANNTSDGIVTCEWFGNN
jgi:hypothetical protein